MKNAKQILNEVARQHHITVDDLQNGKRKYRAARNEALRRMLEAGYLRHVAERFIGMQSKNALEKSVEDYFVSQCEALSWDCLKLELNGRRGFPDRTVITNKGNTYYVELKRPRGGKLSKNQEYWRDRLLSRNCHWFHVKTKSEVDEVIQEIQEIEGS